MTSAIKLRDLVVLGLLSERPRYGYEIKTIIDHLMSHIIDVSSGSLYYGLKKLLQDGLIDEDSIERIGRRPERSVFKITALGQEVLARELPRVIFPQASPFFQMDLALFFFDLMDPHERAKKLAMRKLFLEQAITFLDEIDAQYSKQMRVGSKYILQHILKYIDMELEFIQSLLKDLPEGPAIKLSALDQAEIRAEIDGFKQQVRPEMAYPASEQPLKDISPG